ncbi:MAG: site-2 protease family protein [Myxococcota bacterium]
MNLAADSTVTSGASWGLPGFLWLLVGLVVLLQVVRLVMVLHNLLRLRLQPPHHRPVYESVVPPHVREGLQGPIRELGALGFRWSGWVQARRMTRSRWDQSWQAWLRSADGGTHASISFSDVPEPLHLHNLAFRSFFSDGTGLTTLNGLAHAVLGEYPGMQDPYAPTVVAHWQAHQAQLAVRAPQSVPSTLELTEAARRAEAEDAAYFHGLVQAGHLHAAPDGAHLMGWRFALASTLKLVRGMGRLRALLVTRAQAARAAGVTLPRAPLEEDVAAYRRHDEMLSAPARRNLFLWTFVVTLALFVLASTHWVDPVMSAAVVITILVHELGHFGAMKLLGYQDTSIFFVPFLGGATTGRKKDATLGQEMVVLLAGPVPGLLLAAVLAATGVAERAGLREGLVVLAAINLFNLLPVLPLDGGRILHGLLFSRSAGGDVFFRLLAAGVMLLLAFSGDPVLVVLAVLMVVGIPHGLRMAGLRKRLLAEPRVPGDDDVTALFRVLHASEHANLAFAQKIQLARGLLVQQPHRTAPGCLGIITWLGIYAASLVLGVVSLVTVALAMARPPTTPLALQPVPGTTVPLACPANPQLPRVSELLVRTASPQTVRSPLLYAAFPDEESAQRAARQVEQLTLPREVRGVTTSVVGGALLVDVLVGAEVMEEEPDESTPSPTYLDGLLRSASTTVTSAGGTPVKRAGLMSAATSLALTCSPVDEATATRLHDALRDHGAASRHRLRPPWVLPDDDNAEQRAGEARARRTLRLATDAARQGLAPGGPRAMLEALLSRSEDNVDVASATARIHEQMRQSVRTAMAQGPAEDWDAEVVELFLQTVGGTPTQEAAARGQLAKRLGPLPGTQVTLQELYLTPQRHDGELQLDIPYVDTEAAPHALGAVRNYLCANGCTGVTLRAVTLPLPEDEAP